MCHTCSCFIVCFHGESQFFIRLSLLSYKCNRMRQLQVSVLFQHNRVIVFLVDADGHGVGAVELAVGIVSV